MSEPDVVAELDDLIRQLTIATVEGLAMQRARDEIVALRESLDNSIWLKSKIAATVRAEALEAAALEAGKWATGKAARSAIRAMKNVC